MANPGLYPPPVSMPPGQPPPQQLLAPTYFSPPGVMNFGNPGYPYPPGALPPPPPPHLYSNTQVSRAAFPSCRSRGCPEPGRGLQQQGCPQRWLFAAVCFSAGGGHRKEPPPPLCFA